MNALWWVILVVALLAVVIALWAIDRRKVWASVAAAFAVVLVAIIDPFQAIITAFELRAEKRRRHKVK